MTRKPQTRKPKAPAQSEPIDNVGSTKVDHPTFGQPHPTPDPTKFVVKHSSDNPIYKEIDKLNAEHKIHPLPFPAPRGVPEPRLTLAAVPDTTDASLQKQVAANGQLVFHATGDTGSTRGPKDQNLVADKMVSDFTDEGQHVPLFFLHLGDVIYSFGEGKYYYDSSMSHTVTTRGRSWRLPAITMAWSRRARRHPRSRHFWRTSAHPTSR